MVAFPALNEWITFFFIPAKSNEQRLLLTVVPIYAEHWGGDLQFYPSFNIGGMKLDHDFFHVSKLSEDNKKEKVLTENQRVFVPVITWKPKKV